MLDDRDVHGRIAESHIRVGGFWPLSGLTDQPPEIFVDAVECLKLPEPIASLGQVDASEDCDEDLCWDLIVEEALARDMQGWFGLAHCPVFKPLDGGGCSFSWGHYRQRLFFNEDLDALVDEMVGWGQSEWDKAIGEVE